MKKLFFIIGAPGSGKTTDAQIIAEKNNDTMVHYSTGDLLRQEVAKGSILGKKINSYISQGKLVPLEIAVDTIKDAISNSPKDIILIDGYPRDIDQMKTFDSMLRVQPSISLKAVIEVKVSEETAKNRVLGRARGDDDKVEVFNNRMKVYTEPLKDIQAFYEEKNLLKKIDGERTIEEIVEEMEIFIKSIL